MIEDQGSLDQTKRPLVETPSRAEVLIKGVDAMRRLLDGDIGGGQLNDEVHPG